MTWTTSGQFEQKMDVHEKVEHLEQNPVYATWTMNVAMV